VHHTHIDGLRISGSMDVLLPIIWIVFFFPLEHMGTIGLSEYHLSFTNIHGSFHHVYLSTTSTLPVPAALTLAHFAH